jgi:hypothetical protein
MKVDADSEAGWATRTRVGAYPSILPPSIRGTSVDLFDGRIVERQ